MAEDGRNELVERIADSRREMSAARAELREGWDVPAKARHHFIVHRWEYLGGAALVGTMFVLLRYSARPAPVRWVERFPGVTPRAEAPKKMGAAALLLGVAKIAFDLARPALTRWVREKVAERAVTWGR